MILLKAICKLCAREWIVNFNDIAFYGNDYDGVTDFELTCPRCHERHVFRSDEERHQDVTELSPKIP